MCSDLQRTGAIQFFGTSQKMGVIVRTLKRHNGSLVVICQDQRQAEALAEDLQQAAIIHQWLDPAIAAKRLKKFTQGKTTVLLYVGTAASLYGIPPHQKLVIIGQESIKRRERKTKQQRESGNRQRRRLHSDCYVTIEEASAATKQLGITTSIQYRYRLKDDIRLPYCPDRFYKDWVSWGHFLGKETLRKNTDPYPTLKEAMEASSNLGISNSIEYQTHYRKDPRLPSHPEVTYKSSGWISWPRFCGTAKAA